MLCHSPVQKHVHKNHPNHYFLAIPILYVLCNWKHLFYFLITEHDTSFVHGQNGVFIVVVTALWYCYSCLSLSHAQEHFFIKIMLAEALWIMCLCLGWHQPDGWGNLNHINWCLMTVQLDQTKRRFRIKTKYMYVTLMYKAFQCKVVCGFAISFLILCQPSTSLMQCCFL